MGKKGSWFSAVKKALSPSDSKEKKEKKSHQNTPKKSWFGKQRRSERDLSRIEVTSAYPAAAAAATRSPPTEDAKLTEAENEQTKHAYSVAYATAVAAEAAVAAAQCAAEVVRLTSTSRFLGKSIEDIAAIRIQTAYRGHLARRALRAVRGLGRLKSLIEGQSVKRQATSTLKCMQTLAHVQSQVRSRRLRMSEENQTLKRQLLLKHEKEFNNKSPSGDKWDDSRKSKQEIEARLQSKQEAAIRRERAMAYAHSHQQTLKNSTKSINPMFLDPNNPHWGWSWLERWMAARPWESQSITDKEPSITRQSPAKAPSSGGRVRPESQKGSVEEDTRSFYSVQSERTRRQSIGSSVRDDESFGSSPAVPGYMASTKSTQARSRAASPSPSPLGSGRKGISEKGSVAGSAKKRLSFSGSPARSTKRFPESPLRNSISNS
ncbi:hypothetical protein LXL04_012512 [Taraxacum kok-saghyz]